MDGILAAAGAVGVYAQGRGAFQPVVAGEQAIAVDGQGERAAGVGGASGEEQLAAALGDGQCGQHKDGHGDDGGQQTALPAALGIVGMGDVQHGLHSGRGGIVGRRCVEGLGAAGQQVVHAEAEDLRQRL